MSCFLRPFIIQKIASRSFNEGVKVCVLGASGETGQPLSVLLKQSSWFSEVALFDTFSTKGLAMELNHLDTPSIATSHEKIKPALKGANIVTIVAASPDDDLVENCKIVVSLVKACSKYCPEALLVVGTNPLNVMLPAAFEAYKRELGGSSGLESRVFGATTIDVVRASTLLGEILQISPETINVPVIGGSSPSTAVPLLSSAKPKTQLTMEEAVKVVRGVQGADGEVKKAKESGKSSLAAAFSLNKFLVSLSKALSGREGIIECSLVSAKILSNLNYMACQVELGSMGVNKVLGIPDLSDYECCLLETAVTNLKKDIEIGERLAAKIPI